MPNNVDPPASGTVCWAPGDYYQTAGFPTNVSNPPVLANIQLPQTQGSATLASVFDGQTAAGAWKLYLIEDYGSPVTINGWDLYLTVNNTTVGTTTTVSSNQNPSYTTGPNNSVTFTATVSSSGGTPTGTVAFSANGAPISCGGGNQALSGGTATCTTTFSTQGLNSIEASYTPGAGFGSSSGGLTQLVEAHATPSGNTWCNNGPITVPTSTPATASVYPSVIPVTGVSGTVGNLSVELNGVTATGGVNDQFLLVAPGGGTYNLDILDDAFNGNSVTTAVNITVADNGVSPYDTTATSATYVPYDGNVFVSPPEVWNDTWPSSTATTFDSNIPTVPATINRPQGLASVRSYSPYTLESAFNGAPPNGDWALYIYGYEAVTMSGGWCIDFTELNSGAATTTTVSSTHQQATTGQSVTITATVTSGGNPVNAGTVTIVDTTTETTLASNAAVNGSGQVSFNTSSLTEGDHQITATYSGVPSTYNESIGSVWQRVDDITAMAAVNSTTWQYCNTGAVVLPAGTEGAATPNRSNIFVTNFPGTLNTVEVALNNFSIYEETPPYEASPIEAPGGAALDFFSNTGGLGAEQANAGNYVFEDGAGVQVPDSEINIAPGAYEPTSYQPTYATQDTFISSQSGFYNAPSSFSLAAPAASATFDSTFPTGSNPNGTWSLFFNQHIAATEPSGATQGWCLQLTENPPTVAVILPATDSFSQGQQGASFTVEIGNSGPGSTGDPTAGSNPMTVTDVLNSAFTYANYSGSGWSCSANVQTVTCTNDSPVADGSEYPELTINVNVSDSATGTMGNSVTASGAGVASTNSNTDSIHITPAPVLSVTKTHTGPSPRARRPPGTSRLITRQRAARRERTRSMFPTRCPPGTRWLRTRRQPVRGRAPASPMW